MVSTLKVLHLEDAPLDSELIIRALRRDGLKAEVRRVETETEFRKALVEFRPHIVISDFSLPSYDGLSALSALREHDPVLPFIFVSGTIGEERAAEALRRGATDYVLKDQPTRLPSAVQRALQEADERRARIAQDEKIKRLSRIHAVLSRITSAIIRIQKRADLFWEVCDIAAEHGRFSLAWIGTPVDGSPPLKVLASAGEGARDLPRMITRGAAQADTRPGLVMQTYARQKPIVVNDVEVDERVVLREQVLAAGFRSIVALPLFQSTKVIAVFVLYAREKHFFDQEEMCLLDELANNISFSLEYIEKEKRLNYLAYHDALTGLPNRSLLDDRLAQALSYAKRNQRAVAVLFLDIDRFKEVNDSLGHSAGDRLLRVIAERLLNCARGVDTIARVGGDEFVIVLPDQENGVVSASVVNRILETIEEPIQLEDREVIVSCSIGIAMYPQNGADASTLLKCADRAMYRAKELRRKGKRDIPSQHVK